ncbi:MAG: hypothetical protein NZ988_04170 [Thaumarchaeota archaeon]|nr:hypothetical protein [Candidatus Calditenuaceae archaeon]MDW8187223.1 hypothetical protein [Nitrososphaerota archaeon]
MRTVVPAVMSALLVLGVVVLFPGVIPGTSIATTATVPVPVFQTKFINVTTTLTKAYLVDSRGPVWEPVFIELSERSAEGSLIVLNRTLTQERPSLAVVFIVAAPRGYDFASTVNGFVFRLEARVANRLTAIVSEASPPVVPGLNRDNYRDLLMERAFSPVNVLPFQNPRRTDVSPGPFTLQKERGTFSPYSWLAIWPISVHFHGLERDIPVTVTFSYSLVGAK